MKVSIVTPSFNQAKFIERTILSVLSQDWPSIEYVVFDGASTDGTIDVLQKYNTRIRWVSEKDNGQTDAVNKGILATSGEIIGWLNSDDIYYPGAVRAAAEYFAAHPDIDVVYGMADHIDLHDHPFECYWTEPWDFARLQWHCFICQPATFFRRSVVDRHGLLDDKLMYCMDYEYWLRLASAGVRFGYLERKLAGSRMYADNKTQAARLRVHKEINDVFRSRLGRVPARWLANYAHILIASQTERQRGPGQTETELIIQCLLSELRWNRTLSRDMFWICGRLAANIPPTAALLPRIIARALPRPAPTFVPDTWEGPVHERDGVRITGIYDDGWARPALRLDYPAGSNARSVNMTLYVPKWLQATKFNLVAHDGDGRYLAEYPFRRGETILIHVPLPETAGTVKIGIEPHCRLSEARQRGEPPDERNVTVQVKLLDIRDPAGTTVVFPRKMVDQLGERILSSSSSMKIAFDISQTGPLKAGCGYYVDAMIRGMLQLAPQHSYFLLRNFGDFYFDQTIQDVKQYSGRNLSYAAGIATRQGLSEYWTSSDLNNKLSGADILHANNFWCPRQRLNARVVYTLYDIGFLEEPSWTTEINRAGCFAGVFNAAISADFIVAISKFTRQYFLNLFPSFPADRIEVVYPCSKFTNTTELGHRPKSCAGVKPKKFWLSVGTIEPRKNQLALIRAYSHYLASGGLRLPFVLAGGAGWLMENFSSEISKLGVADLVILTGYVSDDELIWLYRNCFANVYVSFFEGFGLPVLEGMQFGAATIASSATSIPEIASGAAIEVDPHDEAAIAEALLELGHNAKRRRLLSDLAQKRAAQFRWSDSVHQMLDIYARVLSMPKRIPGHAGGAPEDQHRREGILAAAP